jgi:hypothetical protein
MITVTLTWSEICVATQIATMRRISNLRLGTARRYGYEDDYNHVWQSEVISCLAEMAVAKHLDHFWCGSVGDYSAPDVNPIYEVRSTEWPDGRLILHPEDHDNAPYILARVNQSKVTLVGWLLGREGKREEWWTSVRPERYSFFVPNDELHDIGTLANFSLAADDLTLRLEN